MEVNLIKPYGDSLNDGQIQLSFTLPLQAGAQAKEAARRLVLAMGLEGIQIVQMKDLHGFSHFIIYGSTTHSVDLREIPQVSEELAVLSMEEIDQLIKENFARKLVVIGACTGTDAHTVGLDAIMNMKGYDGDYGLERYSMLETYNLGSQVSNEDLLKKVREVSADVVLVSQVVTQRDVHIQNLTELIEMAEAEGLREKLLMIIGGPRIDQALATELGYDNGFGPGTTAKHVATFIVQELIKRD